MDYYEPLPCATAQGDTVEGAFTVLTAKRKYTQKTRRIIIKEISHLIY